jgi:hypothetical protein
LRDKLVDLIHAINDKKFIHNSFFFSFLFPPASTKNGKVKFDSLSILSVIINDCDDIIPDAVSLECQRCEVLVAILLCTRGRNGEKKCPRNYFRIMSLSATTTDQLEGLDEKEKDVEEVDAGKEQQQQQQESGKEMLRLTSCSQDFISGDQRNPSPKIVSRCPRACRATWVYDVCKQTRTAVASGMAANPVLVGSRFKRAVRQRRWS